MWTVEAARVDGRVIEEDAVVSRLELHADQELLVRPPVGGFV
jgi:hypothetical protein